MESTNDVVFTVRCAKRRNVTRSEARNLNQLNNISIYMRIIEYTNIYIEGVEQPLPDALRKFKSDIFQALAHPTRIAIVELLRDEGEMAVSDVFERLGVEQANVSQHLSVLRAKNIVVNRKEGNQVFYSLRDPRLGQVLDIMREYFHAHLSENMSLLQEMNGPKAKSK